jgi:N-methylhydantoinase B
VKETLTTLVQHRRELRTESGGDGRFRGGLGQLTEMGCLGSGPWTVSTLIDRTRHPAPGLDGGGSGSAGELSLESGAPAKPKTVLQVAENDRVRLAPPGGGGYGHPYARDPERVLADVVDGYVSIESARDDYGVAVEYTGPEDRLVRTPELYRIDDEETASLRARRRERGVVQQMP